MKKTDARKLPTEAQQQIRNQAIRLKKAGRTYKEIAEIIGVQPTTVCMWYKAYEKGGTKAIRIKKRGRPKGSCRTLNPDQEQELQKAMRDKCPDQLRLPFNLWTRIAVQQYIKQLWSIDMPIRTVGEYLKRWGFTPQKPLRRAYEQNPKAIKRWYPAIVKQAKKDQAEIHWGDETGLCNDSYHGRSYAPRGHTPAIRIAARCRRVNLISTVTNQGKVRFMVYEDSMNADTLIKFLKRLIKGSEKKIYLILDNLRVHHSKVVKEWLKEHEDDIAIFFYLLIRRN